MLMSHSEFVMMAVRLKKDLRILIFGSRTKMYKEKNLSSFHCISYFVKSKIKIYP